MSVEIKFEIENGGEREGIVAENSYLWDAALRLGVRLEESAGFVEDRNDCVVTVKTGAEHLSTPTSEEMQFLTDEQRKNGERLARQTRIQHGGEIFIMVKEKAIEPEEVKKEREWRKDFQELPFEKKFATLIELEAVALGETLGYIANLPFTLSGKVVDVLAGLGWEMDKQVRETRRPEEHKPESNGAGETAAETNAETTSETTDEAKAE